MTTKKLLCILSIIAAQTYAMDNPLRLPLKLGTWENKTSKTIIVEEVSPRNDGFNLVPDKIAEIPNGKSKKFDLPISLDPLGKVDAAQYKIYHLNDIDTAIFIRVEYDKKKNSLHAFKLDPKTKFNSNPKELSLHDLKKHVYLNAIFKGKNWQDTSLNFIKDK